ncbi:hypothetical protein IWQ57_001196, partial [Coemansia nantahalensis]
LRQQVPGLGVRGQDGAPVEPGHAHQRGVLQGPQLPDLGRVVCAAGVLLCHGVARPHRAAVELRPHLRAAHLCRPSLGRQLRALPPKLKVRRHGVQRQVGAPVGRAARQLRARLHRPHRLGRHGGCVAGRAHHGVCRRGPDRQRVGPRVRPPHGHADRPRGPRVLARLQPGGHAAAVGLGRRDRARLGRQALAHRQRAPDRRPAASRAPAAARGGGGPVRRRPGCHGRRWRRQERGQAAGARRQGQEARRRRHVEGQARRRQRRAAQDVADKEHARVQRGDDQVQPRHCHRPVCAV